MTRGASHADCSQTVIAAHDQGLMGMTVLALHRPVSGWMAIDAARMLDHLAGFGEEGDGPLFVVSHSRKLTCRLQHRTGPRLSRRHSQSRDHDRHRGSKACREHSHFRPPQVFAAERVNGSS
jgi:hypothetical protein